MMAEQVDASFPCALTLLVPFPTTRLASIALQALRVDKELSPLVQRDFATTTPATHEGRSNGDTSKEQEEETVLKVDYSATTNRMLRVAVNGFMDSLALVLDVMEHLDVDVLATLKPDEPVAAG